MRLGNGTAGLGSYVYMLFMRNTRIKGRMTLYSNVKLLQLKIRTWGYYTKLWEDESQSLWYQHPIFGVSLWIPDALLPAKLLTAASMQAVEDLSMQIPALIVWDWHGALTHGFGLAYTWLAIWGSISKWNLSHSLLLISFCSLNISSHLSKMELKDKLILMHISHHFFVLWNYFINLNRLYAF